MKEKPKTMAGTQFFNHQPLQLKFNSNNFFNQCYLDLKPRGSLRLIDLIFLKDIQRRKKKNIQP